jgi:hypothetical protein
MSRMKDLAIEAADHDVDRTECTICGHLPATVPPCYEWERVAVPASHREAPEPIPAQLESQTPLVTPWHGC